MNVVPGPQPTFDASYASEQLRRSRHPLRRMVKGLYLRRMLAQVRGAAIDFGCGAGQLLRRLPPGSVGMEVNPHLVEVLRGEGLTVLPAAGDASDFELLPFEAGRFGTLVMAHVLEHVPDAENALRTLLRNCRRLGIGRVVIVVPGRRGYDSDRTHRTFVDREFLRRHVQPGLEGYDCSEPTYFPGPWAPIGSFFVFHEMMFVLDRASAAVR